MTAQAEEYPVGHAGCRAVEIIGLIGAGSIGANVAELAIRHGHDVVLSNSRGPASLSGLVQRLGPRARAATPADAARESDLVVLATPLTAVPTLPVQELRDKVIIDANNYLAERDGHIAELDDESTTSSEWLQAHLPASTVVKAFQQIHAPQLNSDSKPVSAPERRALAVFSDDPGARLRVAALIDSWGFDPLDGGDLAEGWRLQRDTPGWDVYDTFPELRAHLAQAKRYRDM